MKTRPAIQTLTSHQNPAADARLIAAINAAPTRLPVAQNLAQLRCAAPDSINEMSVRELAECLKAGARGGLSFSQAVACLVIALRKANPAESAKVITACVRDVVTTYYTIRQQAVAFPCPKFDRIQREAITAELKTVTPEQVAAILG